LRVRLRGGFDAINRSFRRDGGFDRNRSGAGRFNNRRLDTDWRLNSGSFRRFARRFLGGNFWWHKI
jgi:hypothetical protein